MEQEKVTEELVRQNGNQAAAVMADYAGDNASGILLISINAYADGSLGRFSLNLNGQEISSGIPIFQEAVTPLFTNRIWFSIIDDKLKDYIQGKPCRISMRLSKSPMEVGSAIIGESFVMSGTNPVGYNMKVVAWSDLGQYAKRGRFYNVQVTSFSTNSIIFNISFVTELDKFLSEQTGFPLFDPNVIGSGSGVGSPCIYGEKIYLYTEDSIALLDEYVDGGDATMSRKLGLHVDNSVIGQLLNMYHNTIIGQLGGGGGGGE